MGRGFNNGWVVFSRKIPYKVLIRQKKPRLMDGVMKIGGDILSHPPGRTVLRLGGRGRAYPPGRIGMGRGFNNGWVVFSRKIPYKVLIGQKNPA
jgi:hypothetical protein